MNNLSRLTTLAASSLPPCPVPLHALELPEGFVLGEGPGYPLFTRPARGKPARRVSPRAFWPIAVLFDGPKGYHLELAFLDASPSPALRVARVPFALLHAPRQLARLLAREGLVLDAGQSQKAAAYLVSLATATPLARHPMRRTTGWSEDRTSFQYGPVPLGAAGRLVLPPGPTAAESALVRTGTGAGWKQAATEAIDASPALALTLATALASPLLRLFGVHMPALQIEGPGAPRLLGAAATLFGSRELVVQPERAARLTERFYALSDLPHLLDATRLCSRRAASRCQLGTALERLWSGSWSWVSNDRLQERSFQGSALVVLPPGMTEHMTDWLQRRYLPLRLGRGPSAELRTHEASLALHQGHLGRALCEALTRLPDEERYAYGDEWRRCRAELDPTWSYEPSVSRWVDAVTTALTAVRVTARLVPTLCPDAARWEAQIEAAWRGVLVAQGKPDPRSRRRLLPGGLDPGRRGARTPSPPQGKTPGRSR